MKRNFLLFTTVILTILTSCTGSKEDRIQDFISKYNKESVLLSSGNITSTKASLGSNNTVNIRFNTTEDSKGDAKNIFEQMFIGIGAFILKESPTAKGLISEGVVFKMSFFSKDGNILTEAIVDESNMDEVLNDINTVSDSNPIAQMIMLLNKNMPIINEDGSKILKIDYDNGTKELIYFFEVPTELIDILEVEENKPLIKNAILEDVNLKTNFESVAEFGAEKLLFIYQDSTGKEILNVRVNKEEIH